MASPASPQPGHGDLLHTVIEHGLWPLLVLAILIVYGRSLHRLINSLDSFKGFGLELGFIRASIDGALESAKAHNRSIDDAVTLAEKNPKWRVEVSEKDKDRVLRRAKQNISRLRGARILWIDDRPSNNKNERRMLRQLAIDIDEEISTQGGLNMAAWFGYDLILSDMSRVENDAENPKAGLEFLERWRQQRGTVPVVFYVGVFNPDLGIPAGAFGITNRPDELLNLVIDVLGRPR